jgi:hypothetical protein
VYRIDGLDLAEVKTISGITDKALLMALASQEWPGVDELEEQPALEAAASPAAISAAP